MEEGWGGRKRAMTGNKDLVNKRRPCQYLWTIPIGYGEK